MSEEVVIIPELLENKVEITIIDESMIQVDVIHEAYQVEVQVLGGSKVDVSDVLGLMEYLSEFSFDYSQIVDAPSKEDTMSAISKAHTHTNKSVLDKLSASEGGRPRYDGYNIALLTDIPTIPGTPTLQQVTTAGSTTDRAIGLVNRGIIKRSVLTDNGVASQLWHHIAPAAISKTGNTSGRSIYLKFPNNYNITSEKTIIKGRISYIVGGSVPRTYMTSFDLELYGGSSTPGWNKLNISNHDCDVLLSPLNIITKSGGDVRLLFAGAEDLKGAFHVVIDSVSSRNTAIEGDFTMGTMTPSEVLEYTSYEITNVAYSASESWVSTFVNNRPNVNMMDSVTQGAATSVYNGTFAGTNSNHSIVLKHKTEGTTSSHGIHVMMDISISRYNSGSPRLYKYYVQFYHLSGSIQDTYTLRAMQLGDPDSGVDIVRAGVDGEGNIYVALGQNVNWGVHGVTVTIDRIATYGATGTSTAFKNNLLTNWSAQILTESVVTAYPIIRNLPVIAYAAKGRSLTINGSSQDLSANRTWTLFLTGTYSIAGTPSVAANSQMTLGTATVAGAVVGDNTTCTQVTRAGIILKAIVTAANTVTIYALNITASATSLPNSTLTINVFK